MTTQFHYIESHGVKCACLGPLTSNKVVLFIGRSNTQKNSVPLQELLNRLILNDYLLLWPESKSRNQSIRNLLIERSKPIVDWLDIFFDPKESFLKRCFRRIVKGSILISRPSKWDYFFKRHNPEITIYESRIRHVIRTYGENKTVIILSHSAGGITASEIANEPNLKKIICFGYPFKHPSCDEEFFRTKNLKDVQKPFLIIQGNKDEYGGLGVQNHYELSPYIKFEFVEATHEYENLSIDDWFKITQRIESFLA